MDNYPGQHEFEDLMSRSTPTPSGRVYLVDIAAELHMSEADLGFFAYEHLSDSDYEIESGTLTEDGADALRTWLSKE